MLDERRSVRERALAAFWARHANPRSGQTRLLAGPMLAYALYRRDRRLLAAALAFVAVNPVLFPPAPDREGSWFARGVRGEQLWLERGNPVLGTGYPEALNVLNVPAFWYALYAALRRRPGRAAVALAASTALKLLFVDEMVAFHDREARTDPDA